MRTYVKTLDVGGQAVQVREISIAEIRAWLMDIETQAKSETVSLYSVDRDLFEAVSLADLAKFTDLAPEVIDGLLPSQIHQVIAAVREVNPDFFAMRERMRQAADSLLAYLRKGATPSSEASAT